MNKLSDFISKLQHYHQVEHVSEREFALVGGHDSIPKLLERVAYAMTAEIMKRNSKIHKFAYVDYNLVLDCEAYVLSEQELHNLISLARDVGMEAALKFGVGVTNESKSVHQGDMEVPAEIIDAAAKLHEFFAKKNIKQWRVGRVQNAN